MSNLPWRKKIKVGILGATGLVGQRFIEMLSSHPWFEIVCLAASARSAGKSYEEAVKGRWLLSSSIQGNVKKLKVYDVTNDLEKIVKQVEMVFSALSMDKEEIKNIEIKYAEKGIAVVSNNSAHRWTSDVPMILPEVNSEHLKLIDIQRKKRNWKKGCIAVKPNCSLQSYVPLIHALKKFNPLKVIVSTYQAISGAGKIFDTWPEMKDNVIPYIGGEEEKSEQEPLKIWGTFKKDVLRIAKKPDISSHCIRVPVTDGHLATVSIKFGKKPSRKEIIACWKKFNPLKKLRLPSSPKQFITFFSEENRPQTKLDRNIEKGMGISVGRLREDNIFDFKFAGLSHNTIRGAAGGAVLLAELLVRKKYVGTEEDGRRRKKTGERGDEGTEERGNGGTGEQIRNIY